VAREWFRHRIGCLTGDTVVTFVDTNGQASQKLAKTMEQLWLMWSCGERDGQGLSPDEVVARSRLRRMRLRVLDEGTEEFGFGRIGRVLNSGIQPVYRITLADGKQLTATENHRLLTDEGWQTLREAVGLAVSDRGSKATRRCRLMVNGLPVYQEYDRPAAERRGQSVRQRLTAHPVPVVSVEYLGLQQTYDLSVEGPWHNLVANGIVVHNSFNEESARYHELEGDFYVPAAEDVRSQVGKPGAYSFEPVDAETAEAFRADLGEFYERTYRLYQEFIERGIAKELARSVLPMGTFTQFYWTVNARSLMNFLSLRAAETAQYEIRRYAEALEPFFAELMPVTYEAFVASGRVAP
jgi:hypothetical protein